MIIDNPNIKWFKKNYQFTNEYIISFDSDIREFIESIPDYKERYMYVTINYSEDDDLIKIPCFCKITNDEEMETFLRIIEYYKSESIVEDFKLTIVSSSRPMVISNLNKSTPHITKATVYWDIGVRDQIQDLINSYNVSVFAEISTALSFTKFNRNTFRHPSFFTDEYIISNEEDLDSFIILIENLESLSLGKPVTLYINNHDK